MLDSSDSTGGSGGQTAGEWWQSQGDWTEVTRVDKRDTTFTHKHTRKHTYTHKLTHIHTNTCVYTYKHTHTHTNKVKVRRVDKRRVTFTDTPTPWKPAPSISNCLWNNLGHVRKPLQMKIQLMKTNLNWTNSLILNIVHVALSPCKLQGHNVICNICGSGRILL